MRNAIVTIDKDVIKVYNMFVNFNVGLCSVGKKSHHFMW